MNKEGEQYSSDIEDKLNLLLSCPAPDCIQNFFQENGIGSFLIQPWYWNLITLRPMFFKAINHPISWLCLIKLQWYQRRLNSIFNNFIHLLWNLKSISIQWYFQQLHQYLLRHKFVQEQQSINRAKGGNERRISSV